MEISAKSIDGKVCSGDHAKIDTGESAAGTTYAPAPSTTPTNIAQCSGFKNEAEGKKNGGLNKFVSLTGVGEDKNWPRGQTGKTAGAVDGPHNSNADAVAKDLVKLNPEEKTIVAGLLAKTIEGGEVVEIRAVSSIFIRI